MSQEKMREEYEETVRKEFASIGKPEPDLRRNSTGDYVHATHAAAWWAWRASRTAVVIELPSGESLSRRMYGPHCGNKDPLIYRHQAVYAIEAAGLKVRS